MTPTHDTEGETVLYMGLVMKWSPEAVLHDVLQILFIRERQRESTKYGRVRKRSRLREPNAELGPGTPAP